MPEVKSFDDFFLKPKTLKPKLSLVVFSKKDIENKDLLNEIKPLIKESDNYFEDINFKGYAEGGNQYLIFAKDDYDRHAGFACLSKHELYSFNELKLDYLYVKGSFRYQGVGSFLLNQTFQIAWKNNCDQVILDDESDGILPWMIEEGKKLRIKNEGNFYEKNGGDKLFKKVSFDAETIKHRSNPKLLFNELTNHIEARYHLEGVDQVSNKTLNEQLKF